MADNLSGYDLSRDWFDWCYENPELITPTHTAMYFFIIDHWNRLGQKEKFGLPMEMTKDALGIKNYKTFSKVFNNLIEWGYIRLLQKSKNQYSSNIVAMVKNTKATTKALTKARLKHVPKQVHGIVGVDKHSNLITQEPNNPSSWRDDFNIYLKEMSTEYLRLKSDKIFLNSQQTYYPGIDIALSLQKSVENYWGTPVGWKNKKKTKTENPDWSATFKNALSQKQNQVYRKKQSDIIFNDNLYKTPAKW
jgi:hypothetical protein